VSPEEIEDRIARITWGSRYNYIENEYGKKKIVILKSPNSRQKGFVSFIYDKALKEAMSTGVLGRFELKRILNERELWGPHEDDAIKRSKKRIKELGEEITGAKKNSRVFKRTAKVIEAQGRALKELEQKKRSMFAASAEVYAEEVRSLALAYCLSYDENDKRLWETWDDFLNETDITLIGGLIIALAEDTTVPISETREVARSSHWRFRWNGAKSNIDSLFGKPIIELDNDQQNLLYWSQVYDSVYESPEPPPEEVIENDAKLDAWFEVQDKQRKKRKSRTSGTREDVGRGVKVSQEVARHGEVFIVTNPDINPNAPDTAVVDELNSPNTRKFKMKELGHIRDKKVLNEKDLRSRNNRGARRIIGSTDAVLDKKSRGGQRRGGRQGGRNAFKQFPGGTI